MAILPAGFALPPLPYLVALVAGVAVVVAVLRHLRPPVSERHVVALVPWTVVGAAGHVLYVLDVLPAVVRPLAGTPAVYATVAVVGGACWAAFAVAGVNVPRALGVSGAVALAPVLAAATVVGAMRGTLAPLWPALGLAVAVALAAATWAALRRLRPGVAVAGRAGVLVVFAHALDGVSTAIGVDLLRFGERTPASRLIIEFARGLPTADALGAGWLFVAVKLLLAAAIVVALADLVREEPTEGNLLLALVVAVGLGPGTHNLLLFAVA
ncbi:MAG: DUF63 family protein [Halorientalis sp.]